MAIDLQQIGQMLGGFGAGIQGQLPQFIANQQNQQRLNLAQRQMDAEQQQAEQERNEKLQEARRKAYYQDVDALGRLVDSGNLDAAKGLMAERVAYLSQMGSDDPSDTATMTFLLNAASNGDSRALDMLKKEVGAQRTIGQAYGYLETPKQEEYTLSPGQRRMRGSEVVAEVAAEPETSFRVLTPQEATAQGLDPTKRYQINEKTKQISQVGGGETVINVGQATEAERTAGILANRLDFAQSQINDILAASPQAQTPEALPTALSALGLDYLARVSNPEERQIIEAAQLDMLDAALTLGTGAAYTKEQLEGYRKSYFPQLGDQPGVIERKAQRLQNLIDAAYGKAGRAAPEQRRSAQPQTATVPPSAASAGVTQDEWNAMTPEERALF